MLLRMLEVARDRWGQILFESPLFADWGACGRWGAGGYDSFQFNGQDKNWLLPRQVGQ
jgi:hypothetical protein